MHTRGLTLIELLIMIAVIGILTAALIANINRAKRGAFDAAALACAHDIRSAQERARTTSQAFGPLATLGPLRSCTALTPDGAASDRHYIYTVRHPKGQRTITVTDSDLYTAGVARNGAVLSSDPAVLAGTGTGPGPGPGPGNNPNPDPDPDACIAFVGDAEGRYLDGPVDGPFTDYWIENRQRILAGRTTPVPGGYINEYLNPYAAPGSAAIMVVTTGGQLTAQWFGTLSGGTFTDSGGEVSGAPQAIIDTHHAAYGSTGAATADVAAFIRAAYAWNGEDSTRCMLR